METPEGFGQMLVYAHRQACRCSAMVLETVVKARVTHRGSLKVVLLMALRCCLGSTGQQSDPRGYSQFPYLRTTVFHGVTVSTYCFVLFFSNFY